MSTGWEKVESSPIEFMHAKMLEEFHKFRKTKTESISVEMNGSEFNEIVVAVKKATYEKYSALELHKPVLQSVLKENSTSCIDRK